MLKCIGNWASNSQGIRSPHLLSAVCIGICPTSRCQTYIEFFFNVGFWKDAVAAPDGTKASGTLTTRVRSYLSNKRALTNTRPQLHARPHSHTSATAPYLRKRCGPQWITPEPPPPARPYCARALAQCARIAPFFVRARKTALRARAVRGLARALH